MITSVDAWVGSVCLAITLYLDWLFNPMLCLGSQMNGTNHCSLSYVYLRVLPDSAAKLTRFLCLASSALKYLSQPTDIPGEK